MRYNVIPARTRATNRKNTVRYSHGHHSQCGVRRDVGDSLSMSGSFVDSLTLVDSTRVRSHSTQVFISLQSSSQPKPDGWRWPKEILHQTRLPTKPHYFERPSGPGLRGAMCSPAEVPPPWGHRKRAHGSGEPSKNRGDSSNRWSGYVLPGGRETSANRADHGCPGRPPTGPRAVHRGRTAPQRDGSGTAGRAWETAQRSKFSRRAWTGERRRNQPHGDDLPVQN